MNCAFFSNLPEDDTALCIYIYLQHQETPTTSTLVITQAGKQVVPRFAELRQPELHDLDPALPPTESPLPATTPVVGHPSDCPYYTASGSSPPMPSQGDRGFHR